MTKATLIPAKTETRTVEVEPAKVVLELTPDQAKTLVFLSRRVGGDPETTRRRHIDEISLAIREAGIESNEATPGTGSIYFN